MSNAASASASASASVFRVDSFVVPPAALAQFMARVHSTHRTLKTLPGCQQSLALQKVDGSGESNVVTIVEWASAEAIDAALAHMKRKYIEEGYDPLATIRSLGIRADLGIYADTPVG